MINKFQMRKLGFTQGHTANILEQELVLMLF